MLHGVGPVQTDGALLEDVLQELGSLGQTTGKDTKRNSTETQTSLCA